VGSDAHATSLSPSKNGVRHRDPIFFILVRLESESAVQGVKLSRCGAFSVRSVSSVATLLAVKDRRQVS
jgi:hypothetical protein